MHKAKKEQALYTAAYFAFWLLTVLYFETILHAVVYEEFTWKYLYILGFSAAFAGILTLVTTFFTRKAGYPVAVVLLVLLMVLYGSQLIYKFIFGTLYSVAQIQQGGAALTSFWKETVATVKERIGYILLLFLPLILLTVGRFLWKTVNGPSNWLWRRFLWLPGWLLC